MALSEEALKMQLDILTSRTDQNADMVYKTNAILNKALDPDVFSGQNSKIVNAINLLAQKNQQTVDLASNVANKVNEILLDTSNDANNLIWQNVKELMEKDTIIEGILHILEGNVADKIIGVDESDKGKLLSVDVDENGDAVIKAIDAVISNNAIDVKYINNSLPGIQNVKTALDYIINAIADGDFEGGLGGGTIIGEITWDMIDDRPVVPNKISLVSNRLALLDEEGTIMSSIPMTTDADIDTIIQDMDKNTFE